MTFLRSLRIRLGRWLLRPWAEARLVEATAANPRTFVEWEKGVTSARAVWLAVAP